MRSLFAAALFACAAWWIARAIGVPAWTWLTPGDRADIALFVFLGTLLLTRPAKT